MISLLLAVVFAFGMASSQLDSMDRRLGRIEDKLFPTAVHEIISPLANAR